MAAFVQHLSGYLRAGPTVNLRLENVEESWHAQHVGKGKTP